MDAGIQAMDGNLMVWHLPDLTAAQADRLPSMDAGFRHPCRNDGPSAFVYNDERQSVGTINF
jgi:hypothetical protein